MESPPQKIITQIQHGIIQGSPPLVGWVLHYADGRQESFALHLPVARQFLDGLTQLVTYLENPPRGTQDVMGMADTVTVRLA